MEKLGPNGSTLYLGKRLNLRTTHKTELNHRISKAWAKISTYRTELTDKRVSLSDRLRLFNAVIGPTVLYGCGCWAMTDSRKKKLRGCQRKMLRTILGKARAKLNGTDDESTEAASTASSQSAEALEPYVEWIQRVTAEAESAMRIAGVPDWVEECSRRKWRWCGLVYRRHDGRWTRQVLNWTPTGGARLRGHPFLRWSEDLDEFAGTILDTQAQASHEDLCVMAQDTEAWALLEDDFVHYCAQRREW